MDGLAGRPGNGPSSPAAFIGPFQAGLIFGVTDSRYWFSGYWWWVPPGGDTASQKFALWGLQTTGAAGQGSLIAGTTVNSGTLAAGQWNFIPLAVPVQLSAGRAASSASGGLYCATTAWTAVNGFPDTANQFGAANPFGNGISNGPLFTFGQNAAASFPAGSVFGTATNDPAAGAPTGTDASFDNFWLDVQVTDAAPAGFAGPYRLYPNRHDANAVTVQDSAVSYVVATEIALSQACTAGRIWYYSPAGTAQLATRASVWMITGPAAGTEVIAAAAPAWKTPAGAAAAAGSGWVWCSAGNASLAAGACKVSVYNNAAIPDGWSAKDAGTGYWAPGGEGASGISGGGPVSAPALSAASLAYVYNGSSPGSTPPFTTGVTERGQCTFAQGPPGQYPYLYVDGLAQNYWTDLEVTPAAAPAPAPSSGMARATVQHGPAIPPGSAAVWATVRSGPADIRSGQLTGEDYPSPGPWRHARS
jgi:hypothetical protein